MYALTSVIEIAFLLLSSRYFGSLLNFYIYHSNRKWSVFVAVENGEVNGTWSKEKKLKILKSHNLFYEYSLSKLLAWW